MNAESLLFSVALHSKLGFLQVVGGCLWCHWHWIWIVSHVLQYSRCEILAAWNIIMGAHEWLLAGWTEIGLTAVCWVWVEGGWMDHCYFCLARIEDANVRNYRLQSQGLDSYIFYGIWRSQRGTYSGQEVITDWSESSSLFQCVFFTTLYLHPGIITMIAQARTDRWTKATLTVSKVILLFYSQWATICN